jgi:hypothetical protein
MNNVIPTEDDIWAAAEAIANTVGRNSPLRESLNTIRHNGHHIGKMIRSIKTGWQYQLPEIVLCGKWLQKAGFEPNNKIWVLPFSELLIVIPQDQNKKGEPC